ncbi:MAG: hypothetical protein HY286_01750 [Planctomycetes bacterium]|nr:hypothetical protein [Planctomycetota bacterium]
MKYTILGTGSVNLLKSAALGAVLVGAGCKASAHANGGAKAGADVRNLHMSTTGRNDYFILEPGYRIVLEKGNTKLTITVTNETKNVNGIDTRVVVENEEKGGVPLEISRNFFAICTDTKDVYYLGEEVDVYKNGKIDNHEGAWLADHVHAKAGIAMPGRQVLGERYLMENAPGVAMDFAEAIDMNVPLDTPAGHLDHCMKVKEGSELNASEEEFKIYAPGIGLVEDEGLKLSWHGFIEKGK